MSTWQIPELSILWFVSLDMTSKGRLSSQVWKLQQGEDTSQMPTLTDLKLD